MAPAGAGLVDGRAAYLAGDVAGAIIHWQEALSSAYTSQDHAMAFVLTKNLGDALLLTAKDTSDDPEATWSAATQATAYYDYALGIIDTCELSSASQNHAALADSISLIRRRRRRAIRLTKHDTPDTTHPSVPQRVDDEVLCTTCEHPATGDNPIVVDEADGCPYCRVCFDAYYAAVEEEGHQDMPTRKYDTSALAYPQLHERGDGAVIDQVSTDHAEVSGPTGLRKATDQVLSPRQASTHDHQHALQAERTTAVVKQRQDPGERHVLTCEETAVGGPTMHQQQSDAVTQPEEPPQRDDHTELTTLPTSCKQMYQISELRLLRAAVPDRILDGQASSHVASGAAPCKLIYEVTELLALRHHSRSSLVVPSEIAQVRASKDRTNEPRGKAQRHQGQSISARSSQPNEINSWLQEEPKKLPVLPTLAQCEAVEPRETRFDVHEWAAEVLAGSDMPLATIQHALNRLERAA